MNLGIDGFRTIELIGRGGFGSVYSVRDEVHGRDLAVKVLPAALDDSARRQFDRERRAMGALSGHPAIGTVHTSGFTADGQPYIAMELLRGGSLADRLAAGPLPIPEVLAVAIALADALAAAHEAGVLHLDIKPENVLFDQFGTAKLVDFGIAALAEDERTTSAIRATPAYAAPEVLDGAPPTAAADVYGLAVTIYALLMGNSPYAGDSVLTVLRRIAIDPVPEVIRPDAPPALCVLLRRAMDKSPDGRPGSMAEFADALRSIDPTSSPAAPPPPPGAASTVAVAPLATPSATHAPAASTSTSTSHPVPTPPSTFGDPGPSNVPPPTPPSRRVPTAALVGAGAGLLVVVIAALVLFTRGDDSGGATDDTTPSASTAVTVPDTGPDSTPPSTAPASTTPASTTPASTVVTPASTASITELTWASDIDEAGQPVDSLGFIPDDATRICATWRYDGIAAGTSWQLDWYLDGEEFTDWSGSGINAAGADSFFACGPPDSAVPAGLHEIEWSVDDELLVHLSIYVGNGRVPVVADIVNATDEPICRLNLNATPAREWSGDWVTAASPLDPGGSILIEIPTGEYDVRAIDCDGTILDVEFGIDIDSDRTIRIEAS